MRISCLAFSLLVTYCVATGRTTAVTVPTATAAVAREISPTLNAGINKVVAQALKIESVTSTSRLATKAPSAQTKTTVTTEKKQERTWTELGCKLAVVGATKAFHCGFALTKALTVGALVGVGEMASATLNSLGKQWAENEKKKKEEALKLKESGRGQSKTRMPRDSKVSSNEKLTATPDGASVSGHSKVQSTQDKQDAANTVEIRTSTPVVVAPSAATLKTPSTVIPSSVPQETIPSTQMPSSPVEPRLVAKSVAPPSDPAEKPGTESSSESNELEETASPKESSGSEVPLTEAKETTWFESKLDFTKIIPHWISEKHLMVIVGCCLLLLIAYQVLRITSVTKSHDDSVEYVRDVEEGSYYNSHYDDTDDDSGDDCY